MKNIVLAAACAVPIFFLAACGSSDEPFSQVRQLATAPAFPLQVATNGRYLIDQAGQPFRINSDAAWFLSVNATASDVDTYIADRKAKGFTSFIVMAMVHQGGYSAVPNAPKNRAGNQPFLTPGDFSTPNDAYWTFIDSIVDKAAANGMAVILAYQYLGWGGGAEGWWNDINSSVNTRSVMFSYGAWLGNRYKNRPNVIWYACGDYTPPTGSEGTARVHSTIDGIKSVIPGALFAAEMSPPDSLSTDAPDLAGVMDMNSFYGAGTPNFNAETFYAADRAWKTSPAKPAWMGEPNYENVTVGGTGSRQDVRKAEYWSVLAGGTAGQSFGTEGVWDWLGDWRSALGSAGSQDMQRQFGLYAQLPWYDLVPEGTATNYLGRVLVVSGQQPETQHIAAAATRAGTWLLAYTPPTGTGTTTFGIDMSAMNGSTRARWFNPTSGSFTTIATGLANSGARSYTTPGDNGTGVNDWVLVLDANGQTPPPPPPPPPTPVLTTVSVSPTSTSVATGGSVQFRATGLDQSQQPLSPQPTFTWTASGGGTISSSGLFTAGGAAGGPFTVTAKSGSTTGSATVSVISSTPSTAAYRINAGGSAVPPFSADSHFSGGTAASTGIATDTANVQNAAPAGVYTSSRYGNFTYTLDGLTAGNAYTVRLHFAEPWWTSSGQRSFDVTINGTRVLASFDVFAAAGGANRAVVRDFSSTASSTGQITIVFTTLKDNATINGIEVLGAASAPSSPPSPPSSPGNTAPTVSTAPSASPSTVTGTSTQLSVLGADDGGESGLSYTWATTGTPPAGVSFSANQSNAAKNAVATFTKTGSYSLRVTITDAQGLTTTSSTSVTVSPTTSSVTVAPGSATVATNGATAQFTAAARDQFGAALSLQPTFSWTVTGGGTINSSGLFTSGSTAGGPYTVRATTGSFSGTGLITVSGSTQPANITIGESSVLSADDWGNGNLMVAQLTSLSQVATIKSLSFYVTTAAGKLRLGIYDATGPGGGPGAKVAETSELTPVSGWNTGTVVNPVALGAGNYWLVYLASDNNLAFKQGSPGSGRSYSFAYGTLPVRFSTSPTSWNTRWSFFATLTP